MNEKNSFEELLNKVQKEQKYLDLFSILSKKYFFSRLLLAHRDKIFPKFIKEGNMPPGLNVNMSYMYWTSYLDNEERMRKLEMEAQEEKEEENNDETEDKTISEDEEIFNAASSLEQFVCGIQKFLGQDIKQLASYSMVQLGRKTQKLKECITSEDLDYHGFLKKTQGMKEINLKGAFEDMFTEGSDETDELKLRISEEDKLGERILKKGLTEIFIPLLSDPLSLVNLLKMSLIWKSIIESGSLNTFKILKDTNIGVKEYNKIMRYLYNNDLIFNYHSIAVCSKCDDDPLILDFSDEINLLSRKIKCPRCYENMDLMTLFNPKHDLKNMIFSQDGLLSFFAGNIASKYSNNWQYSTYEGQTECDFIVNSDGKKIIIEIKMFTYPEMMEGGWKNFKVKINKSLDQLEGKILDNDSFGILLLNLHSKDFVQSPKDLISEYGKMDNLKIVPFNKFEKEIRFLLHI